MKKNPEKKVKVILEYEPAEDAEKRLQMAFDIILSGIQIPKKTIKKRLTNIQEDVK